MRHLMVVALAALAALAACAAVDVRELDGGTAGRVPVPGPIVAASLDAVLREHRIVTAGFGVIRNGELAWSHYYGEESPGLPADAATRFNVASITKTVVTETVLRIVDDGQLDLDEPLVRYWVDPDVADDPRRHSLALCPRAQGYGLGFEVADFGRHRVLGHGGSDWSEQSVAYVYQPSGDGVIVFLNAPNARTLQAMPEVLAAIDPSSPFLARYRAWRAVRVP